MKQRAFGTTGVAVSEIGLGCWQLGGTDWGDIDEKAALGILASAVEAGVNFFDTADVYGNGRSETLIGRFLKGSSEKVFVATKLGRTAALYPNNYTEASLREATEASLRRLGVATLDLTQLHCIPTEILRRGEVFEWLRKLQREGKIRHFGVSVETIEEGLLCLKHDGVTSLQVIFNLFRQRPAQELFPQAKAKGVAIIVRLPLASGLLSGKLTRFTRFAENDHRNYNRDGKYFNVGETFSGLRYEKGVELADALKKFVPEGMTMAEMAQRWLLDQDAVSVLIPGASRSEQALGNARVSDLAPLPPHLHAELRQFYANDVEKNIRGPY